MVLPGPYGGKGPTKTRVVVVSPGDAFRRVCRRRRRRRCCSVTHPRTIRIPVRCPRRIPYLCVCVCVIPIVVAYIRHVFVTLSILVTFADLHARTRAFYILRQYIRVRPSVCSCIRFGRHQRGIWFCHCHTRRRYPFVKDSDREIRGPIVSRVTHSIHIVTVFRSPRPSRDRIYRR